MKKILIVLTLVLALLPLGAVIHKIGEYVSQNSVESIEIVGDIAYIALFPYSLDLNSLCQVLINT